MILGEFCMVELVRAMVLARSSVVGLWCLENEKFRTGRHGVGTTKDWNIGAKIRGNECKFPGGR